MGEFVVGMGIRGPLVRRRRRRRRSDGACGPIENQRGEAVQPRNGLSSSGSGSSITYAGTGSTPQKSANGANENENNTFLWINSGARLSVEASVPLSHFGSIDEDWDVAYWTSLPPNGVSCPAAKVS